MVDRWEDIRPDRVRRLVERMVSFSVERVDVAAGETSVTIDLRDPNWMVLVSGPAGNRERCCGYVIDQVRGPIIRHAKPAVASTVKLAIEQGLLAEVEIDGARRLTVSAAAVELYVRRRREVALERGERFDVMAGDDWMTRVDAPASISVR